LIERGKVDGVSILGCGAKIPDLHVWASLYANGRMPISKNINKTDTPLTTAFLIKHYADLEEKIKTHFPGKRLPAKPQSSFLLVIRYLAARLSKPINNGQDDTEYKGVYADGEVSHCAEAYKRVEFIKGYKDGPGYEMNVELVTTEDSARNKARAICARHGLMWIDKKTGKFVPKSEWHTFKGDVMCPHAHDEIGCYGPPPADDVYNMNLDSTDKKERIRVSSEDEGSLLRALKFIADGVRSNK
jgi:hypothetical protein